MALFRAAFLTLVAASSTFGQTYTIYTIAGSGSTLRFGGDGGPATSAELSYPLAVALDSAGNLYIADSNNNRIRKVSNGVITTVAGNGTQGYGGDGGPATSAELHQPYGVAVDSGGSIYIADQGNNRIRKVSNGVITTVAGNGTFGFGGDGGPATSAELSYPYCVALDSAGNLYIADYANYRIRKVSNGAITTVAGNGTFGLGGDGGPATSAMLTEPSGVALDSVGNLYIADSANNRIRKVSNGVITTVAGSGTYKEDTGFSGDGGAATSAELSNPLGVAVDSAGNLYIADFANNRIRKVSNGVITTIAGSGPGNGPGGFSGDNGPAASAMLALPTGVAVDPAGSLYIADQGNNRIRLLTPFGSFISSVTSGASNLAGPIAPGEIIVLYGSGIGPAQLVSASGGTYGTQLAGVGVTINGAPAPIIYTSATQVGAIVPYGTTGANAQVTVTYQGQTTAVSVPIAPSAPGVFTLNSTGEGQAAAVNQDGTINGAASPANRGDIVSLYATGEGQTTPPGVDGKLASVPLPQPILPVTVTIGGQPALVQYAGGAPGEVAGLMQVNVQIPSGLQTGNAGPVVVQIGNASSQSGVTIAVR